MKYKYKKVRVIGQGVSGRAILAQRRLAVDTDTTSQIESDDLLDLVVLKEIRLQQLSTEKERELARKEVDILARLNHPNIISYYDSFEEGGKLYIVQEYAEGGK